MAFPQFRALRLNGGTSDAHEALLLEAGTWLSIEGDADRDGPCVWGGGSRHVGGDVGDLGLLALPPGGWRWLAAFPHDPPLSERGLRDGVGRLYLDCHERGDLILAGARAVDLGELLRAALERFGRPVALAADRWRDAELRDVLDQSGRATGCADLARPGLQGWR